jgi:GDPmannose 4,6-dehydratase
MAATLLSFSSRRSAPPSIVDHYSMQYEPCVFFPQGYEVHGIKRHASTFNQSRIEHLFMHGLDQKIHTGSGDSAAPLKLHMHYGDVLDINSLVSVFLKVRPDEIYNLAAQSHVRTSFDMPV